MTLPNCWEILDCGREPGGANAGTLGVCVAAAKQLGHRCWGIAGTLCGGEVQGTAAQKKASCMTCEVYRRYHQISGTQRELVLRECSEEVLRYQEIMSKRLRDLSNS